MDASRLLEVLYDVEVEFNQGTSPLLADLIQHFTAARDTPSIDNSPAIQTSHVALIEYVTESLLATYPPSKIAILKSIGGLQFVGRGFLDQLNEILTESGRTTAGTVTSLSTFQTDLEKFRKSCKQTILGLENLDIEPHKILKGSFEAGVLIPETLVNTKLGDLTKELKEWNQIFRCFQELAGDEEREVTISDIASGSFEFYFGMSCIAAGALSKTIDKVFDWYLKILEIQKKRKEIELLGAPVMEAAGVKRFEHDFLQQRISDLTDELIKERSDKVDKDRVNELKSHIHLSITQIALFVDRGGTVQVDSAPIDEPEELESPAEDDESTEEYEKLKADYNLRLSIWNTTSQIRREGSSLRGLPDRPTPILQLSDTTSPEGIPAQEKHRRADPPGEPQATRKPVKKQK